MKQSPSEEKMERCTRNCNLTDCINNGGYKECVFYEMIELPRKKVESPSETLDELTNKIIKIVSRYQCSTSGNEALHCALQLIHDLGLKVESPSEEGKENSITLSKIELVEAVARRDARLDIANNKINTLESSLQELEKGDQEELLKELIEEWRLGYMGNLKSKFIITRRH